MSRPILLDLFCGAGGAAMGYSRAGFEVVGVDIKPQPNYPFEFIQGDAMEFIEEYNFDVVDAVHASPPCQAYIQRNKNLVTKWPKLIEPVRAGLQRAGIPYVIENVAGAPLHSPLLLCGTMFNLTVRRHRLFECGPTPLYFPPATCCHWGTVSRGQLAGVYGRGGRGPRYVTAEGHRRRVGPVPAYAATTEFLASSMGIDWMTRRELYESIPPAYTEYIGKQLLEVLA